MLLTIAAMIGSTALGMVLVTRESVLHFIHQARHDCVADVISVVMERMCVVQGGRLMKMFVVEEGWKRGGPGALYRFPRG